ncbi:Stealth protein CR2, conserved region 2 [Actinacidiphila glaucinigra]|uniref:Stealth protein CR2, conserved region 2 n=2 Tax=Actinacidiphila glaucinigra TaxID=235986 RepID=A0A239C1I3_9ACTN|nr:sugar phosphotransferase [Actinacidiphila glaucinigra]SNS14097.1 Stealth protein CR2, conserved region 2 [Actinacidiphila glaucinigra]
MSDSPSMSSAAHVYKRLVPQPMRSAAASTVPGSVRRKVKRRIARTLSRREARLHLRALSRVRKADFGRSERRVRTPDGRVGHVHTGLTVDLARRLDHDLVTNALDAAEIPWFAVPALDDRRVCIAVEHRDKGAVRRALRALLEEHTGYVVSVSPGNNDTAMIPGSHVRAWKNYGKATVVRITWLRTEPTENHWVGEDQGIEIEFWTVNADLPHERLIGPRPNRVQRAVPRDALGVEIGFNRLCGYSDVDASLEPSITLEGFDIPRLEEIAFPVDVVLEWQHATPWGEELLRAALRSVHQYAPWIDVVHVVAQAPVPQWLHRGEHLTVTPGLLGAEHRLHRLPDLADHFLLLRPGALLGRPVRPFDYFTPHGSTRPRRGPWTAEESFSPWAGAAYAATGCTIGHGYAPGPQPHSTAILGRLDSTDAGALSPPDGQLHSVVPGTHPVDGLAHHIGYVAGLADLSGEASAALHAAHPHIGNHLERLLARRDSQQMHFFGLGSEAALSGDGTEAVLGFLRRYFPVASPFERQAPDHMDARP